MDKPRSERRWHVRKIGLKDEDDLAIDRAMSADMTLDERIAQMWTLVVHLGDLTGVDYRQQRLQRSVTSVQRRRR